MLKKSQNPLGLSSLELSSISDVRLDASFIAPWNEFHYFHGSFCTDDSWGGTPESLSEVSNTIRAQEYSVEGRKPDPSFNSGFP